MPFRRAEKNADFSDASGLAPRPRAAKHFLQMSNKMLDKRTRFNFNFLPQTAFYGRGFSKRGETLPVGLRFG